MNLSINNIAPKFCLRGTDLKEVCLSEYRGRNVLLLFFPFAFSGVCTTEMCSLKDDWKSYVDLGVTLIAISVDSPFSLKKFEEEIGLSAIFLSDFNKETLAAYGALHEAFALGLKGVSKRAAFVINKEGKIKYIEVLDNPKDLPNFAAVKNVISLLD